MVQAKRPSTHKQYNSYLKAWHQYCAVHNKHPFQCNYTTALDFLETLRTDRQLGYNALNTARSALSSILVPIDSVTFGKHHLVKTYMRGAFNIRPPAPRYKDTWDPTVVLTLISQWHPPHQLDLKKLTLKLLMLTLLVSGQRLQTLSLMSLDNMHVSSNSYSFVITDLLKQTRPGYKNPTVVLRAFPSDERLCIFLLLQAYIQRTAPVRKDVRSLFLCFRKPYGLASKDTLSRWAKLVLAAAGIDTAHYTPHSTRSASSSAAKRGGAPLKDILDTAGWTGDSVFARFYDKPLSTTSVDTVRFDVAVLSAPTVHGDSTV